MLPDPDAGSVSHSVHIHQYSRLTGKFLRHLTRYNLNASTQIRFPYFQTKFSATYAACTDFIKSAQKKSRPAKTERLYYKKTSTAKPADYAASASSSSTSASSALAPRFGPFARFASIRRTDSVSDSLFTAATSRAIRSRAAS